MPLIIKSGDFSDPRVTTLLRYHFEQNRAVTPEGSAHVLDLSAMQVPEISFWTIWEGQELLGMGALKRMNARDGEVKSMRTYDRAQRRGVASAMVKHIIAAAGSAGLARLFLETGSFDYFRPARELYTRHGFVECGPFEGYKPDRNSTFMVLQLS
ncbi:MAG: GNAT family N-acetyltransferase [Rhabdaerophilum sp.]